MAWKARAAPRSEAGDTPREDTTPEHPPADMGEDTIPEDPVDTGADTIRADPEAMAVATTPGRAATAAVAATTLGRAATAVAAATIRGRAATLGTGAATTLETHRGPPQHRHGATTRAAGRRPSGPGQAGATRRRRGRQSRPLLGGRPERAQEAGRHTTAAQGQASGERGQCFQTSSSE